MLAAEATYNWYYFVDIAEAGNYVAEVRALPGCLSQEKTHKEAIFSQYQTIVAGLKTLKIQGFQYISKYYWQMIL